MQRPSARSHIGRISRTSGVASAMRKRRSALGNCLRRTTQALTITAMTIAMYCSTNDSSEWFVDSIAFTLRQARLRSDTS